MTNISRSLRELLVNLFKEMGMVTSTLGYLHLDTWVGQPSRIKEILMAPPFSIISSEMSCVTQYMKDMYILQKD